MTASSLLDPDQIVFPKLGLDFRINDTAFTVFGFDIKWYSPVSYTHLTLPTT